MDKVALYVQLEAQPGKEEEVEKFLRERLATVEAEPHTNSWFAVRLSPSTYAIFDTFSDESGREEHLAGKVAEALKEKGADLFIKSPMIAKLDVLASKTPHSN